MFHNDLPGLLKIALFPCSFTISFHAEGFYLDVVRIDFSTPRCCYTYPGYP